MSNVVFSVPCMYQDQPQHWDFDSNPDSKHYPTYFKVPGVQDLQKLFCSYPLKPGDPVKFVVRSRFLYDKDGNRRSILSLSIAGDPNE